jgi:hypothetical protein
VYGSDFKLGNQRIGVQFLVQKKIYIFSSVQTNPWNHPPSYPIECVCSYANTESCGRILEEDKNYKTVKKLTVYYMQAFAISLTASNQI